LFFRIEEFECNVPPHVEPAGHRNLEAVNLVFRAGFNVIRHCLRSSIFRGISSHMLAGIGSCGLPHERRLGVDAARAFRTASEKFSKHARIVISLYNSVSKGIGSFK